MWHHSLLFLQRLGVQMLTYAGAAIAQTTTHCCGHHSHSLNAYSPSVQGPVHASVVTSSRLHKVDSVLSCGTQKGVSSRDHRWLGVAAASGLGESKLLHSQESMHHSLPARTNNTYVCLGCPHERHNNRLSYAATSSLYRQFAKCTTPQLRASLFKSPWFFFCFFFFWVWWRKRGSAQKPPQARATLQAPRPSLGQYLSSLR